MSKKLSLEIEDIKKLIPQRFPFLMIDRVLEASPEKVVAIKNVTASEQFFKGHFPEQPVMPGA
ncbi:MAG: 3-hydroxyacyl-[acyl-carrier-protein] dehydratase FabZ, partial [Candidatus Omnitrophica bacterium]|nr:3-hydroxyacyl-[acyl-carrier-protein] dehydratase FabZ [Candidatus Omnitrophota bacterium]